MQQLVSLEDVEKIMDETADAVEYQRQISDLLSGGLTDEDESDVSVYTYLSLSTDIFSILL